MEKARVVYPKETGDWTRRSGVNDVISLAKRQSEPADVVVLSGKLSSVVLLKRGAISKFAVTKEGCDMMQFIYRI
jgi:hypothetical protein